ncbi:Crp/Fnr family transcriptional regulator [Rhodospirillaceae bacterium SYSU D60014]|uniref:Crp/Fnr family transcriptional regulator n=1 Tax=Virgifigura deserti TaxID=2268457 RepID=UPI0013C4EC0E
MADDTASQREGQGNAAARSLKGLALFDGLDEAELRRLETSCRWRLFRVGEQVLETGSDSRDVFFIVQGAVNIVDFSLSGREIGFATAGTGTYFGELSAIDGQPRSAYAIAAEDSLLASLAPNLFLELLQRRAEITFKVLQRLAQMVRAGDLRIMELSTLAATQRVYAELLRMAVPDSAVPGLWVVRPLPPLREIASRTSTTRETVNRALAQLYPLDLLRRKGRNLYVMNRAALEDIVRTLQLQGSARA